jgi:parvulin-like peptidyl-prolyl isomerase
VADVSKKCHAAGADWATLVKTHSDETGTARREGWLGVVTNRQIPPQLAALLAVFDLKEGEISQPVESGMGFHILRRGPSLAKVAASHILINWRGTMKANVSLTRTKDDARKLAETLLAKVKAGGNFAQLAREHSSGPSAARGGAMGQPFGRMQMDYAFEKATFALPVGGISGVVETPFGFHIIKRTE